MACPGCPLCLGRGTYRLGPRVKLREKLLTQHGLGPSRPSVFAASDALPQHMQGAEDPQTAKEEAQLAWLRRHLLCGLEEQERQTYRCPFCFPAPVSSEREAGEETETGQQDASRFSSHPVFVPVDPARAEAVQQRLHSRLDELGVLVVEELTEEEVVAQFIKKERPAASGLPSGASTENNETFSASTSSPDCALTSPSLSAAHPDSRSSPFSPLAVVAAPPVDLSGLSAANQQIIAQLVRLGYPFERALSAVREAHLSPILHACVEKAEELEANDLSKLLLDLGSVEAREELDIARASRTQKTQERLQLGLTPLWEDAPEFMRKFVAASPLFLSLLTHRTETRLLLHALLRLRDSAVKAYPLAAPAYLRNSDSQLSRLLLCLAREEPPVVNAHHRRLLLRCYRRTKLAERRGGKTQKAENNELGNTQTDASCSLPKSTPCSRRSSSLSSASSSPSCSSSSASPRFSSSPSSASSSSPSSSASSSSSSFSQSSSHRSSSSSPLSSSTPLPFSCMSSGTFPRPGLPRCAVCSEESGYRRWLRRRDCSACSPSLASSQEAEACVEANSGVGVELLEEAERRPRRKEGAFFSPSPGDASTLSCPHEETFVRQKEKEKGRQGAASSVCCGDKAVDTACTQFEETRATLQARRANPLETRAFTTSSVEVAGEGEARDFARSSRPAPGPRRTRLPWELLRQEETETRGGGEETQATHRLRSGRDARDAGEAAERCARGDLGEQKEETKGEERRPGRHAIGWRRTRRGVGALEGDRQGWKSETETERETLTDTRQTTEPEEETTQKSGNGDEAGREVDEETNVSSENEGEKTTLTTRAKEEEECDLLCLEERWKPSPDEDEVKAELLNAFLQEQTEDLQETLFFSNIGSVGAPPRFLSACTRSALLLAFFSSLSASLSVSLNRAAAAPDESEECLDWLDEEREHRREDEKASDPRMHCAPLQRVYLRLHLAVWPPALVFRVEAADTSACAAAASAATLLCPDFPLCRLSASANSAESVATHDQRGGRMDSTASPCSVERSLGTGENAKKTRETTSAEAVADRDGTREETRVAQRGGKAVGVETQKQGNREEKGEREKQEDTELEQDMEKKEENTMDAEREDDDCLIVGEVIAPPRSSVPFSSKLSSDEFSTASREQVPSSHWRNSDRTTFFSGLFENCEDSVSAGNSDDELQRALAASLWTYNREQSKRKRRGLITDFFQPSKKPRASKLCTQRPGASHAAVKRDQKQGRSSSIFKRHSSISRTESRDAGTLRNRQSRQTSAEKTAGFFRAERKEDKREWTEGGEKKEEREKKRNAWGLTREREGGRKQVNFAGGDADRPLAKTTKDAPPGGPQSCPPDISGLSSLDTSNWSSASLLCYHGSPPSPSSPLAPLCSSPSPLSASLSSSAAEPCPLPETQLFAPQGMDVDRLWTRCGAQGEAEEEERVEAEVEKLSVSLCPAFSGSSRGESNESLRGKALESLDSRARGIRRPLVTAVAGKWKLMSCPYTSSFRPFPTLGKRTVRPSSSSASSHSVSADLGSPLRPRVSPMQSLQRQRLALLVSDFSATSDSAKATLLAEMMEELWHAAYADPRLEEGEPDLTEPPAGQTPGEQKPSPVSVHPTASSRLPSSPRAEGGGAVDGEAHAQREREESTFGGGRAEERREKGRSLCFSATAGAPEVEARAPQNSDTVRLDSEACGADAYLLTGAFRESSKETKVTPAFLLRTGNWIQASCFLSSRMRENIQRICMKRNKGRKSDAHDKGEDEKNTGERDDALQSDDDAVECIGGSALSGFLPRRISPENVEED
ncbi:hypothetical protein TGME49_254860 [Toxoplasma gondii ME49]|uniref:Uncharacterized protein n=1 Tax=Toxoplasma gondii (strain ATCC 50611 / Me49) TaxID=508771 RepID=S8GSV9_TOXGM|nr:hypothetical protein TGME49_254860 [Toxoplasma gondii ME49]EPT31669.1 hypothetical protein TGME49_254860 [Toxoplasma gondii ME49]|eukprot:XP_018638107.1 hypothetical protein TGME49_254860 [Toxoplasma gondii ME49]